MTKDQTRKTNKPHLFDLGDLAQIKATGERFRVGEMTREWDQLRGWRSMYGRDWPSREMFDERDLEVPRDRAKPEPESLTVVVLQSLAGSVLVGLSLHDLGTGSVLSAFGVALGFFVLSFKRSAR